MKMLICSMALICGLTTLVYGKNPKDNPYQTLYKVSNHWTSEIPWDNVTSVEKIKKLVNKKGYVDSTLLHNTMRRISEKGGGVLFFPAGTYYFDYHVYLYSNVVIRGEAPEGIQKATDPSYTLNTRFEFPKFNPAFEGKGTPHNVVKRILGDTTAIENAGLVYLDINRATVEIHPSGYEKVYTTQGMTMHARSMPSNIIILGNRINNSIALAPDIPSKTQVELGYEYLRWPLHYIGNINLDIEENGVIANNRINDHVTDNFTYSEYMTDMEGLIRGERVTFSYLDQPAIVLNHYKVTVEGQKGDVDFGPWGPHGLYLHTSDWNEFDLIKTTDKTEPHLFPKGKIEVIDNFMVTNSRTYGFITLAKTDIINERNVSESVEEQYYLKKGGDMGMDNYLDDNVNKMFSRHETVMESGDTLRYRLYTPENPEKKKLPVILYLHAEDMSGFDNNSQLNLYIPHLVSEEIRKEFPAYILAPQDIDRDRAWNAYEDQVTGGRVEEVLKVMDKLIAEKDDIDPDRVYLMGLSNGSTSVLRLGVENKDRFAALVALDGVEITLDDEEAAQLKGVPFFTSYPKQLSHLSLFLNTRLMAIKIKRAGGDVFYRAYPSESRPQILYELRHDEELLPWLFSKSLEGRDETAE